MLDKALMVRLLPWASPYVRAVAVNLRHQRGTNAKLSRSDTATQLGTALAQAMRFTSVIDPEGKNTLHCLLAQVHASGFVSPDEFNVSADAELQKQLEVNAARATQRTDLG